MVLMNTSGSDFDPGGMTALLEAASAVESLYSILEPVAAAPAPSAVLAAKLRKDKLRHARFWQGRSDHSLQPRR